MNTLEQTIPILYIIVISLITSITAPVMAQSVTISADLSATELLAGDEVDLIFTTVGESDVYFFSVEVTFDTDIFEYVDIKSTGLTEGELALADFLSPGVIGAAVTRTSPLSAQADGDVMILSFRVKEKAPAVSGIFTFSMHTLGDSEGQAISSVTPEQAEAEIKGSIAILELTTPAMIDVTEGDEFHATGKVFANGVTIDDENEDRIRMWIGVNDDNTNPASWDESVWQLMDFTEKDSDDFFNYSGEIAFQRDLGVYYITLRSDLDLDGEFKYGGLNGFWDQTESPSTVMEIHQQPQFRYTIAAWDFDDETLIPSQAVPDNQQVEVELFGASFNGFTSGASGQAANSNGWGEFEEDTNYWQVMVSTENLEDLRISSKQRSTGSGPRDFQLQTSLNGEIWNDVSMGTIVVGTNFTEGVLENVPLGEVNSNQEQVYIRWVQTTNTRVTGNDVVTTGSSQIDDIIITGINPNAERVNVWPGDTDHSGEVDEMDVLPLGIYWLSEGPKPVYNSFAWEPRETEEWIPKAATYADAAGSGRVDQNDLQLVGLNFGKTHEEGDGNPNGQQQKMKTAPISPLVLEPLQSGQTTEFYLVADGGTELSGVSFRLDMAELSAEYWSVDRIEPLDWVETWIEENRLINFQTVQNDFLAVSMVHKGFIKPVTANNLVRIVIKAEKTWNQAVNVQLNRASVTSGYDIIPLRNAELSSEMAVSIESPVDERPQHTQLLPNYPNPFNPSTTIPYTLSEAGNVQVEIFDAIGRRVAIFHHEAQQPGKHSIQFDASSLSSGLYLYRMQVNGEVQTRKMTLLK